MSPKSRPLLLLLPGKLLLSSTSIHWHLFCFIFFSSASDYVDPLLASFPAPSVTSSSGRASSPRCTCCSLRPVSQAQPTASEMKSEEQVFVELKKHLVDIIVDERLADEQASLVSFFLLALLLLGALACTQWHLL